MKYHLTQLKDMTIIVADTGDVNEIARLKPMDATTNPSLLLKSAFNEAYRPLIQQALVDAKSNSSADSADILDTWCDHIAVRFGLEILKNIPGRVSTEVDARLSFDTQATILKAKKLISIYKQNGISSDRVLIKIAATWEGIKAAQVLESEGIQCNLTLLFSLTQAIACAEAKAYLISPFVGRILDWYKLKNPQTSYMGQSDPGVQSVHNIYHYFKYHDYKTVVMGASFRNIEQIIALAGCDRLTISPALLDELNESNGRIERILSPENNDKAIEKQHIDEKIFRWQLNDDPMATEKLSEGIRKFAADQITLESKLLELNLI